MEAGHRLRKEPLVRPAADAWQSAGVVIVGGGMAGLSAGRRLLRAGFDDFVVLELEPALGGTSRSGRRGGMRYPWGAHYLPVPMRQNAALVALLDEMGVLEGRDAEGEPIVAEQFLCRDPQERLFFRGRWYEGLYLDAGATADDRAQLAAFEAEIARWADWRDASGRRAFALPVAHGSDDAEVTALDRQTMADWLDAHGWHSPRLRWLVDYACRDDYGAHAEQTSAWAGVFYFASRIRRSGMDSQPYITWPEGNGRLVAHLARRVGARARTGWAVCDVAPAAPGANRVEVIALATGGSGAVGYRAGQVIFAAPQFLARHVIRDYRRVAPPHLAAFEHGAWMVSNVLLRDRPPGRGFPLAWDNVFYESESLGYVVATHQALRDYGPTVLTHYLPLCDENAKAARARLYVLDWRDCASVVLADLARAHPGIERLVERIDVVRWAHAMVRPAPGLIWGGARAAAVQPDRGIHFAHTDLSVVALVEEAFYHGIRAAEEVLAARGIAFRSEL